MFLCSRFRAAVSRLRPSRDEIECATRCPDRAQTWRAVSSRARHGRNRDWGVRIINKEVVDALGISTEDIETIAREEEHELERREKAYRGDVPAPKLEGKTVILVDDGIATGSTMLAAIAAARQLKAAQIVVAVPTVAASTYRKLREVADEVVALITPENFYAVGQWYESFPQTTDDEVRQLPGLRRGSISSGAPSMKTKLFTYFGKTNYEIKRMNKTVRDQKIGRRIQILGAANSLRRSHAFGRSGDSAECSWSGVVRAWQRQQPV